MKNQTPEGQKVEMEMEAISRWQRYQEVMSWALAALCFLVMIVKM